MKKILFILSVATLLTACDKIETPYTRQTQHIVVEDNFPLLDTASVYPKILVEEYTGHRCVNCPDGHELLEELCETYGDTLIPMCIHSTALAAPFSSYTYDFRTEAGEELASMYGIQDIPKAVINRVNNAVDMEMWQSTVPAQRRHEKTAAIQLMTTFADNTLTVYTKTTILSVLSNSPNISLFLVEDGIVKPQKYHTGMIEEYVHNHVLRANLTSIRGESTNVMDPGQSFLYGSRLSFVGHDWVAENCSIIAILWFPDENSVIQVERIPVISER